LKVPKFNKVKNINPNTKRVNLIVKVLSVTKVADKTFAEAVVGDDTAVVTARVNEDQIPVAKVGCYIRMQNAFVTMYMNHLRVTCDKWAAFEVHDKQTWEVNDKEDISKVEYELVTKK